MLLVCLWCVPQQLTKQERVFTNALKIAVEQNEKVSAWVSNSNSHPSIAVADLTQHYFRNTWTGLMRKSSKHRPAHSSVCDISSKNLRKCDEVDFNSAVQRTKAGVGANKLHEREQRLQQTPTQAEVGVWHTDDWIACGLVVNKRFVHFEKIYLQRIKVGVEQSHVRTKSRQFQSGRKGIASEGDRKKAGETQEGKQQYHSTKRSDHRICIIQGLTTLDVSVTSSKTNESACFSSIVHTSSSCLFML